MRVRSEHFYFVFEKSDEIANADFTPYRAFDISKAGGEPRSDLLTCLEEGVYLVLPQPRYKVALADHQIDEIAFLKESEVVD